MPINSPNIFCYDIDVEPTNSIASSDVFEVIGDITPISGSSCKDSTFVGDVFSVGLVVGYGTKQLKRDSTSPFTVTFSGGSYQVPFDAFGNYNRQAISSNVPGSFYVSSLKNQVAANKASAVQDPTIIDFDGSFTEGIKFGGNDYFESDTIADIEQQLTVAIVFKFPDRAVVGKNLIGSSTASDTEKAKITLQSSNVFLDFGSTTLSGATFTDSDEDKFQLMIFQISGGTGTQQTSVFLNRSATDIYSSGSVGTNGIGPKIKIGADADGVGEWVGEIGEVLIWDTRFTNNYDIADLQKDICDRWNIE